MRLLTLKGCIHNMNNVYMYLFYVLMFYNLSKIVNRFRKFMREYRPVESDIDSFSDGKWIGWPVNNKKYVHGMVFKAVYFDMFTVWLYWSAGRTLKRGFAFSSENAKKKVEKWHYRKS